MTTLSSSFAIGYTNLATNRTITATTSATGFPASNLSSPRLSSSHHTTNGSLTSQNIDVDLGSSQSFDIFGLVGTNLTSSATRTPVVSENSSFTSPEYAPGSGSVFDNSYPRLIDPVSSYGRHLLVFPGSTQNARYVRLTLNNSGNPDNYLSSRVYWVGPIWQPGISFGLKEGSFKKRLEFIGVAGIEKAITILDVAFDVLSEGEGEALKSICAGRLRTGRLLVIPRPTQAATWQGEALYCTLQGAPALTAWPQGAGEIRWKVQLTFRECED